jgi:hypothetical protein
MHTEEGRELLIVAMPDAGEPGKLLSTIDNDPCIALQVKDVLLSAGR